MPPRLAPLRSVRALPLRPRAGDAIPLSLRAAPRRYITADEKPLPKTDTPDKPGPNEQQLPHVSEEAAATAKVTGETAPQIEEQGTPVQEVLNRDKEAKQNAPKVMQDKPTKSKGPAGTRSYSTSARRMQEGLIQYEDEVPAVAGHKFAMPAPLTQMDNIKHRYDPVIKQVTNLLMIDGKLSAAQTNMARILNHLRTSPPPKVNPLKPLLPGAPPAAHLPLNPVLYLQLAIDSVAPLLKIRGAKGQAGGGAALQLPTPLNIRQRRRQSVKWIIDTASKKPSRGSGRGQFAQRVAEEIIAIVEGKSGVWEKRMAIHKLGTAARSNMNKVRAKTGGPKQIR